MTTRLMIADDHEVIRIGLATLVAGTGIEVVAQAANGNECLKLAEKHKPDVILVDVRMPEGDGLEALEKLREKLPDTKVVMFSSFDNPTHIAQALALGASDYLLKDSPRKVIIEVIQTAAAGKSPSASGKLRRVANTVNNQEVIHDDRVTLTRRESQIVRLLTFGLSNDEIHRLLRISLETVKEHVANILRKFDMKDRCQVAVWAVRKGLM
jgi:DNA-binding NarL/FixJ family response regulator